MTVIKKSQMKIPVKKFLNIILHYDKNSNFTKKKKIENKIISYHIPFSIKTKQKKKLHMFHSKTKVIVTLFNYLFICLNSHFFLFCLFKSKKKIYSFNLMFRILTKCTSLTICLLRT